MKKFLFFCLNFFFLLPILLYSNDPTAADEEAVKYRTEDVDPKVFEVPESISGNIGRGQGSYLKQLVDFLAGDTGNEFEKVKRIHDWITENIAYDNDYFYGAGGKGDTLSQKRGTCGDFANLFKEMAQLAGLEAITISGKSRVTYDSKKKEMASHIWNAVKIKNKWYIVDTTHDSRFSYTNKKFRKKGKYRATYLFVSPKMKIINNFPDKKEHQFLETPISFEDFLSFPLVSTYWFKRAEISFLSDLKSKIKKVKTSHIGKRFLVIKDTLELDNEAFKIRMSAGKNVLLFARIKDSKGKSYDDYSLCHLKQRDWECVFSAPGKGKYNGYISAKIADKDKLFNKVYEFKIEVKKGRGPAQPEPYQLIVQNPAGIKISNHNFNDSKAASYHLELAYSDQFEIFSSIWNVAGEKFNQYTKRKVLKMEEGQTFVRYDYDVPAEGTYFIKVRIKGKGEKYYTLTALFVKVVK